MEIIENNETLPSKDDQLIIQLLKTMESKVSELNNQINLSGQMLPLGVDTGLTKDIKKLVDNPLLHLYKIQGDLTNSIQKIVSNNLSVFFNKKR